MGIFSTIGQAIGTFCAAVWKGLQAIWSLIKKVVSTLFDWAVSVLGWAVGLAADIVAGIIAGTIIAFIWIFGDDDEMEGEDDDEKNLGQKIGEKLGTKHPVIKGVWDKQKKALLKETEVEATNTISSSVKTKTGGSRFAELEG